MYRGLYTYGGVRSSLRMNFSPSANGCSNPNGPTRVGPHRFWMCAETLRSSQTLYATTVSSTKITPTDLISETTINAGMVNWVFRLYSCIARVARALRPKVLVNQECDSTATSVSAALFSYTEFKVCEKRPKVPDENRSSFAGAISSGWRIAPP